MSFNCIEIFILVLGSSILIYDITKHFLFLRNYGYLKPFLKVNKYKLRSNTIIPAHLKKSILHITGKLEYKKKFCLSLFYGLDSIIYGWFIVENREENLPIERDHIYCLPNNINDPQFLFPFRMEWIKRKKNSSILQKNNYQIAANTSLKTNDKFYSQCLKLLNENDLYKKPYLKMNKKHTIFGFEFSGKISAHDLQITIGEGMKLYRSIIDIKNS